MGESNTVVIYLEYFCTFKGGYLDFSHRYVSHRIKKYNISLKFI